jgi:hypothetical protein
MSRYYVGKFNQHNGRRFRRCVYDLNNPPEMSAQDRGSAKRRERMNGRAGIEPKGKREIGPRFGKLNHKSEVREFD